MDLGIQNKRALVLGGTSGIGFAIAQAFLEEGARVVVASRDAGNIESAVGKLRGQFPKSDISGQRFDLADLDQARNAFQDLTQREGVDILINNVGGPAAGKSLEISLEDWDRGYTTLLKSVLLMSQLAVPWMSEKKWGRILNITSTSAREIIPNLPVSSTFRAALSALTKGVAKEVGRSGVLINNVLPGPTNTDRLQHLSTDSPAYFNAMKTQVAIGRIAEPIEIGRAVVFLCSAVNTYITGTDVVVDGGYTSAL